MKKAAIACVAFLVTVFSAAPAGRNPIDLVVVLDTSSSMNSSYKEVSEYIVGPLLTEFLKIGDTFHLLSFSDTTRNEISCRIDGFEDIKTVIGRLMLMYPLDPHTDFISALDSVYQYLRELPESRTKTVVLISDGEHSPPATSPNAGLKPEETVKRIESSTAKLKGNGWTFYFIKIPFSGNTALPKLAAADSKKDGATSEQKETRAPTGSELPINAPATSSSKSTGATVSKNGSSAESKMIAGKESGQAADGQKGSAGRTDAPQSVDVTDVVSGTLSSPIVEWSKEDGSKNVGAAVGVVFAEFPTDLGKKSRSFSIPIKIKNPSESAMYLETSSVSIDGIDRMTKKSFYSLKPHSDGVINLNVKLPDSYTAAATKLVVAPAFEGKIRLMPDQAEVRLQIIDEPFSRFFGAVAPYLLFILGLVVAAAILILIISFLRRSLTAPTRAAVRAASGTSTATGNKLADGRTTVENTQSSSVSTVPRSAAGDPQTGHKPGSLLVSGKPAEGTQKQPLSSSAEAFPSTGAVPVVGSLAAAAMAKDQESKTHFAPVAYDYSVKKENTRIMLSLWVQDQSKSIGRRNVHLMKSGSTLSLGGGRSDFLVFLVPIPHRIADIHYDGMTCSFVPRRPEYFPDSGSNVVADCVGKTIRVVSDKGYEMFIKLEMFEDPLLKLNAFLHSIDTAGRI